MKALFTGDVVSVAPSCLHSRRVLDFSVFEVCSILIVYPSIKVTFSKTVDQKSDFQHPCCCQADGGRGCKAVNLILLTAARSVFVYLIGSLYLKLFGEHWC